MSDHIRAHPAPDRLAAYALLLLVRDEADRVRRHLVCCSGCRALLAALPEKALITLSATRVPEAAHTVGPPPSPPGHAEVPDDPAATAEVAPCPAASAADTSFTLTPGACPPAGLLDHPRYQVLEMLGSGGMGVVYKARHRLMDRLVALKVIHPRLADRPAVVERFCREARAAARLAHPNIVAAHDAEQAGESHFLVMEYVAGTDLEQLLWGGARLAVPHACNYVRQAALGLQHAFEQGMVHRDIKPHNLMLTLQGQVKILDFGLARFLEEGSEPAPEVVRRRERAAGQPLTPAPTGAQTRPGMAMGTADYLAPEEARDARGADIRADIYSLGCTLYRFLTGRVAFPGGTFEDKVRAQAEAVPTPVAELCPEVPPALAAVVARLMAKHPDRRYQTPAEAAQALTPFIRAAVPTVLVVAADAAVRDALRSALEDEGYPVAVAADRTRALAWARSAPTPGLIVLGLNAPGAGAADLLWKQNTAPALAGVPVLVLTARDRREARAAGLGAAGYLRGILGGGG